MSSVQLIFVFLRSVLRSRTELAPKNLVFTNAAQPTTEVQSRWTSAGPLQYNVPTDSTGDIGHATRLADSSGGVSQFRQGRLRDA